MSDFRNILKAGLMVTASILAVGCTDKNETAGTGGGTPSGGTPSGGTGAGTPSGGTGGGAAGGGTAPVVALENPTSAPILAQQVDVLKETGKLVVLAESAPKEGDLKVFDHLGSVTNEAVVSLMNLSGAQKIVVDGADKSVGAMFFDTKQEDGKPHGKFSTVDMQTNLNAQGVALDDAVVLGSGDTNRTITTVSAVVGINAAIGYKNPNEDEAGKALPFGSSAAASLELDKKSAKGHGKSGSKKTKSHKSLKDHKSAAKSHVKHKPTLSAKEVNLVVDGSKVRDTWKKPLDDAHFYMYGEHGSLELSGRVASLETKMAVVTSTNGTPIEYDLVGGTADKHQETDKKATKKHKLGLELDKKKSKANNKATAKKTKHTSAASASHSKKTKGKPTTSKHLVKKSGEDHHFLFKIKDGFHAEIGKWVVNEDSEYQYTAHNHLIVHEMEMKHDLGLRVFVQDEDALGTGNHTLIYLGDAVKDLAGYKMTTTARQQWKTDGEAQKMMSALVDRIHTDSHAPIHESTVVEEGSDKESKYLHFDSHTPFGMIFVGNKDKLTVADDKAMRLHAMDLARDKVIDDEGVYMLPLVKDFTGKFPNSQFDAKKDEKFALALNDKDTVYEVDDWSVASNGFNDVMLFVQIKKKAGATPAASALAAGMMGSNAAGGRSVPSAALNAITAHLDPTNLVAQSFANVSTARVNQAAQVASLVRGEALADSVSMGAVDQYNVTFDHEGLQFGLTYTADGGNAFVGGKGTTAMGANIATKLGGLTAITSFEASADAGKSELVSSKHASYQAAVTFAKAYNAGGLSVVPMAGLGVATASLRDYNASLPMAAGTLGLSLEDASFAAATFHAGVNFALDGFVAESAGVNASMAFGVAGFLGSQADAKLHTSEGRSADLHFSSHAAAPYAQFALDFATGERVNAMVSTGTAAVSFSVDR